MSDRQKERLIRIAVLQAGTNHSRDGNPGLEANWALFARLAREAAAAAPDLIVLPEYALSGWPYPPEEAINGLAEPLPGDGVWYQRYVALARETGTALLCWLVESADGRRYNSSFLLDPTGTLVGKYRKVHANLGEQTWWGWSQGESLQPLLYKGTRYGISICADMWFPETVRCEELLGADVIVHQSIADDMGHILPTRAFDSQLPIVAAIYNGGSYAVDAQGALLGKLPAETPGWQLFELAPFQPRLGRKYGGMWNIKLGNQNVRNPGAYDALVDPATRPPWTRIFLDNDGQPQTREQLLQRFGGRYDVNDPALYHEPLVSFPAPWTSPYTLDARSPFQLVNREGEHLFIVNKTAWAYFGCRDPQGVIERARAQGVNVLRVALEGRPYYPELGIELWPWGGSRAEPEWSRWNEGYWAQVEERVRLAGEQGLGFDIVLNMALHPGQEQIAAQQAYWQEALHRLGRYANVLTWEIANEYTANEAFQDAAGAFLRTHDPYGRPVCSSDGTTDDALWPQKDWMSLAINHTCTSSTARHPLRDWYLAVARNTRAHGKPAFCNESGREMRHGNDDGVHRRKQGWLWCAAGGFWTWHSWDGCEGIDDRDYRAPGAEFLKPMADCFRSLPFWTLDPTHTTLTFADETLVSAVLCAPDRSLTLGYVCTPDTGERREGSLARLRLPDGVYEVECRVPADGARIETRRHTSPGLREAVALPLPAFADDLLVLVRRIHSAARSAMPGTG